MDRRTLLRRFLLAGIALPFGLRAAMMPPQRHHKTLILIEFKGGNDGLNTVIPYNDPLYYRLRPRIAIGKDAVLPLNDALGLHPSLQNLRNLFDGGEVALYQGLGYPDPNRSHFRSIEIWETASRSDTYLNRGWLAPVLENVAVSDGPKAAVIGGSDGPLSGMGTDTVNIENIERFLRQATALRRNNATAGTNPALEHLLATETAITRYGSTIRRHLQDAPALPHAFPRSALGRQFESAARLLGAGLQLPVIKCSLGSFDTHSNQLPAHARLLQEFDEGIAALRQNLIALKRWGDVRIMTYSEFGRRAAENGSLGTDHGTAAPHFLIGEGIRSGIIGTAPSLGQLDSNGDLRFTTDFLDYYAQVLRECGLPDMC